MIVFHQVRLLNHITWKTVSTELHPHTIEEQNNGVCIYTTSTSSLVVDHSLCLGGPGLDSRLSQTTDFILVVEAPFSMLDI